MAKAAVIPKKKRGPPATGKGTQVGERWHPTELAAIDAWIASSSDKTLTRAHAILRPLAIGYKVRSPANSAILPGRKARSAELAKNQIKKMIDPSASPDERDRR